jgi:hypothetical protein
MSRGRCILADGADQPRRSMTVTFTLVELDDVVLPVVLAAPPLVPAALPVVVLDDSLVLLEAVPCVPLDVPDVPDVPDAALFVGLLVLSDVPPVVLEAVPVFVPLDVPDAAEPEPPAADPDVDPDDPPGVMIVEPPEAPPEAPPVEEPLEAPPELPLAPPLEPLLV